MRGLVYDVTVRWHGVHGHILQNITRQLLTNAWRVRHDGVRSHRTRFMRFDRDIRVLRRREAVYEGEYWKIM